MTERALWMETVGELPSGGRWERLYLGPESCPWLLPTAAEANNALGRARSRGLGFTLVTPSLPEETMPRAEALLDSFSDEKEVEVVINDYGLLELFGERKWGFKPVLGRLLVKGSAAVGPGGSAAAYLEANSLHSPPFLSFVRGLGVERVETDRFTLPPPGFGASGLAASYHHPRAFVTLAGRCPWRFDGRRWRAGTCPGPCRGRSFSLVRVEDGLEVTVSGRAQEVLFEELPGDLAARGVDRIVSRSVVPETNP